MELKQIRSFLAVAEDLHFRRAAERLGMAQPAVSKQIRLLEEELGARLFIRSRREVRVSPEGLIFQGRARDILASVREAGEAVRRGAQGREGKLEIAYNPALEIRVVPRVFRRFRRRYPAVDLRLVSQNSVEQHENLRRRRLDAGFMLLPARDESLNVRAIGSDRLVLVTPSDHPLGGCPGSPLSKLHGEPFVILGRRHAPEFFDLIISATRAAGVSLRIAAEARSVHENLSLVASGIGVALLPSAVRDIPWKGVSYCPVDAGVPRIEVAVGCRRDDDSGLLRNFLGVVRELYRVA